MGNHTNRQGPDCGGVNPPREEELQSLHSDILILFADLKQFLETREPGTTLGVTLHASLKKVLREKVQRMSERIANLEKL